MVIGSIIVPVAIPLAEPQRPEVRSRSAEMVLTAIFRDTSQADSVDETEERRLVHFLHSRVRGARAAMAKALDENDLRQFRHRIKDFFAQSSVRLWATYRAQSLDSGRLTLRRRVEIARALDVMTRWPAPPRVVPVQKDDGRIRETNKFRPADEACAHLVKAVLDVVARKHPRLGCAPAQSMTFGGWPTACSRLIEALEEETEATHFVQIDVRNFFPSISGDFFMRFLPLPAEVVQRHVIAWARKRVCVGDGRLPPMHVQLRVPAFAAEDVHTSSLATGVEGRASPQCGVAQGLPSSSSAAEIVMGRFLSAVGQLGVTVTVAYSDNLGFLCRSREEAEQLVALLTAELKKFDGGPFDVSKSTISSLDKPFDFLGCSFRRDDGKWVAGPKPSRADQWHLEFSGDLLHATSAKEFQALWDRACSFAAAYQNWPGAMRFRQRRQDELDAAWEGILIMIRQQYGT